VEIAVATANPGKLKEIRALLHDLGITFLSLNDLPYPSPLEEEGRTYLENAATKSMNIFRLARKVTIAEDSGLEVDALGGQPGLHSRRFGGKELTDSQRNALLLDLLKDVPEHRRTARFRSVVALVDLAGQLHMFEGVLEGTIATSQRGTAGFGYDPVFLVPRYGKTIAELGPEVKNRISHRARAFEKVRAYLEKELLAGRA